MSKAPAPKRTAQRSGQPALRRPGLKVHIALDQPAVDSLPPQAVQVARLDWGLCQTDCFVGIAPELATLYIREQRHSGEVTLQVAATMDSRQAGDLPAALMDKYLRWLMHDGNQPQQISWCSPNPDAGT